ncbi:probable folate-biopterin transporter 6 [Syzygium oleosum]|uniref:probable folate-biopterin transporter 6 n=1 Tax=Syzygium oleosum TaxID=219896 RepID=UPI0011D19EFD|nr:probable folate-biopterin transporter 6 [Syzygium oleosum]
MGSLETEKLVQESLSDHHRPPPSAAAAFQPKASKNRLFSLLLEPIQWLQMLSANLNPTFILGVFVVYGLNQGFAGSFFRVVSDFYWKDVQRVQPSSVQLYSGLYYIPWIMKPLWGLLTDVFPVMGYRRRPYFVAAGVLGATSAMAVAAGGRLPVPEALAFLVGLTAAVAIADVTIDACVARNSIEMAALAPDMQSLCGLCSSAGALIGYSTSGFFVHHIGAQGALGILAIPPALLIGLGFVIHEGRTDALHSEKKQKATEKIGVAMRGMYETIKLPQVWKPSLYMYLSFSLNISTHEGQFYWYTDPEAGPAFSQEFVGMVYAVGALASMVGVLIYQKALKDCPFRKLLFSVQFLYAITGMLDLVFVRRWNLALGVPDSFFVIAEECVSRVVSRIRWMPMIVLSTKLCPLGIEGMFFALLMCIDSLGFLSSKMGGGLVLRLMHVTRTDFRNLWLALLIRNVLRLATLGLIFLVPEAEQSDAIVASGAFSNKNGSTDDEDDDYDGRGHGHEGLQLVPTSEQSEV